MTDIGKWVELPKNRDEYGLQYYKIAERKTSTNEVRLTNPSPRVPSKGFWIYEAHCIKKGAEIHRRNMEDSNKKRDDAQKIGLGKPKKRG